MSVKQIPQELFSIIAGFQGKKPRLKKAVEILSPQRLEEIKKAVLHAVNRLLCYDTYRYLDDIIIPFDSKIFVSLAIKNNSRRKPIFVLCISGGNPNYVYSTDKHTIPYRDGYDIDQGLDTRYYFPVEKKNEVFTFIDWLLRNYRNLINKDDYNEYLLHNLLTVYQHDSTNENENKDGCQLVDVRKNAVVQEMMVVTKIIFQRFSALARDREDKKRRSISTK